ncbi:tetratricopeptide (TPR) repeat protein [Chromobacterium alkanivorans]|uniref:tetratricopeptide repeat protein n=1 Tax=Chromobacterium alkanivorans TaxID=1071719 RepID=UPI0021689A35|nr:tetratricopeptide repeat protein [Chromobacterium alkanivorans]MCS3806388.1 tetratricopeptide (TPR) repeat protein [Chromobacterium alkanivorans]MCS3820600.1 tetratricopeptide (TPR) repeat protein [Chromobacterium alkanivorans]MCS3875358.1 tetratricopeptide (TPR) repeat protein [Chromobacterium alkanivorans]
MDYAVLDQEELFQLALQAMESQQHAEAVALLKQGVRNDGEDARLRYLLGAEYAQIGLFDRAAAEMEQAVALQPGLVMAVFQLGLLHLTQGLPERAEQAWQGLDALAADHPLQLFRQGLSHLIRDEFADCRERLMLGIAANQAAPMLNEDMKRILEQIDAQQSAVPETEPAAGGSAGTLLLRGYASSGDDKLH